MLSTVSEIHSLLVFNFRLFSYYLKKRACLISYYFCINSFELCFFLSTVECTFYVLLALNPKNCSQFIIFTVFGLLLRLNYKPIYFYISSQK